MARKKVGLALSGGGGRGFAHIGVLKILEKNKIPIDMIAGTSMGALIGAFYCAEPDAKKLEKEAYSGEWNKFFDYTFPRYGLIKGDRIEQYVKNRINNVNFQNLKIPLYISTFDIEDEREVIFSRGEVAKAVRASISIPGVFVPVRNKNKTLVDGGVADPVPTEILRKKGADIVIGVNVNHIRSRKPLLNEIAGAKMHNRPLPGIIKSATRSMQILFSELSDADLDDKKADLIISINLGNTDTLDFSRIKQTISAGESAARKSIHAIKDLEKTHVLREFIENLRIESPVQETIEGLEEVPEKVEKKLKEASKIQKKIVKNLSKLAKS